MHSRNRFRRANTFQRAKVLHGLKRTNFWITTFIDLLWKSLKWPSVILRSAFCILRIYANQLFPSPIILAFHSRNALKPFISKSTDFTLHKGYSKSHFAHCQLNTYPEKPIPTFWPWCAPKILNELIMMKLVEKDTWVKYSKSQRN